MKKSILFILFSLFIISCRPKNIFGLYRSKFAESGFFVTDLQLKKDSSFYYYFSGDLVSEERVGKYHIRNKILYLQFDTIFNKDDDSIGFAFQRKFDLKKSDTGFPFHLKYKIKGDKLYSYNLSKEGIKRKSKGYTPYKKYIFFGPHWYKRNFYLRKIDTLNLKKKS